jgi:hypothetical protein
MVKEGRDVTVKGSHTCDAIVTRSLKADVTSFVEQFLRKEAEIISRMPLQIYQGLLLELNREFAGKAYAIPGKAEVEKSIRDIRGQMQATDIASMESPPLSVTSSGRHFLRRNWYGDIRGEYHRVLIWTSDALLALLRYEEHTFIDGTFKIVPKHFYQCVIVMTLDRGTNLYVPCVYALMTAKSEYLYCVLLHEIIVMLEYRWKPSFITTDFECSLIGAVRHEFPTSCIVGCYFHFKQALSRRMEKLRLPQDEKTIILSQVELLTLVHPREIKHAISFIRSSDRLSSPLWVDFWDYFQRTWMGKIDIALWNLHDVDEGNLFGRTNNALERYNRLLGEKFFIAHPPLNVFIAVIRGEELYFTTRLQNIRIGQEKMPVIAREWERPPIPNGYVSLINKQI